MLESLFNKYTKSDFTFATSNERILQQVMCDFFQRAISATSTKQILQWVMSDFLQWVTSATNNKRILQGDNEKILQQVTSDFTTCNEQLVNFNE